MKIKSIILTLLICVFLGVSYYIFTKVFIVNTIQLKLQDKPKWEISKKNIQKRLQLKLKKFIGQNINTISFDKIINTIRTESHVGSIKILKVLPSRVFIQLSSRKPLLVLLNSKNGKIHPLSIKGKLLPAIHANKIPNLPILRGDYFLTKIEHRKNALNFVTLIPEQGEFSQKKISEIKYSKKENSLILILSKNGKSIKVGYEPINMKPKRIKSVLKYLNQKNIKWNVIEDLLKKSW